MEQKRARSKPKWTKAEIKAHVRKIEKAIELQRRATAKGWSFVSVPPELIETKLQSLDSPMLISVGWTGSTRRGRQCLCDVTIYNPDRVQASPDEFTTQVWFGYGYADPTTGTYLLNADPRFPRLTQPDTFDPPLGSGDTTTVHFSLQIPSGVEPTIYPVNFCLTKFRNFDVGRILDRCVIKLVVD